MEYYALYPIRNIYIQEEVSDDIAR